jgi:hypothetical protein
MENEVLQLANEFTRNVMHVEVQGERGPVFKQAWKGSASPSGTGPSPQTA